MTRKTPGRTPARKSAGSGRAGDKRALRTPSKQERTQNVLAGLGYSCWKKLARRAGVKRMSDNCLDASSAASMPQALHSFARRVIGRIGVLVEYHRRRTVTGNDVALALKQEGRTLYGKDCDWTYGFYNKANVRRRVAIRPSPQLLARAALARIGSQADSCAVVPATPAQPARPVADDRAGVAGVEDGQMLGAAPASAASAAAQLQLEAFPGSPGMQPSQQQQQQQQQQLAAVDKEQAMQVDSLTPEQQRPALAGAVGDRSGAMCQDAAGQPESSVPCVRTPDPMSQERAEQVLAWMADVMLGPLQQHGCVQLPDLVRVMWAKHGVSRAECQDTLFVLEREERILLDPAEPDAIYLCS